MLRCDLFNFDYNLVPGLVFGVVYLVLYCLLYTWLSFVDLFLLVGRWIVACFLLLGFTYAA